MTGVEGRRRGDTEGVGVEALTIRATKHLINNEGLDVDEATAVALRAWLDDVRPRAVAALRRLGEIS